MNCLARRILFCLAMLSSGALAQTTGDFRSVLSGPWNASTTWEQFDGSAWVPAAAFPGSATTDTANVTIQAGDTVIVDQSGRRARNLTVEAGAVLTGAVALPTSSIKYVRVYGTSLTINGVFGGEADVLSIEAYNSVSISGTGTARPARLRPGANITGITLTIDMDMTMTYAGTGGTGGTALYTSNNGNDSVTVWVKTGRILSFLNYSSLGTSSSPTADASGSSAFIVDGMVILNGNSSLYLRSVAGKTSSLTVNGTVRVGKSFYPSGLLGNSNPVAVNAGGLLEVGFAAPGVCDLSAPDQTIAGAGGFTLDPGTVLKIGSPDGLVPGGAAGALRTAAVTLSPEAAYTYCGIAPQTTGLMLPAVVKDLALLDTAGVTVAQETKVTGLLTLGGKGVHGGTANLSVKGGITYAASVPQVSGPELPISMITLTVADTQGVALSSNVWVDTLSFVAGKLNRDAGAITLRELITGAGPGRFVEGLLKFAVTEPRTRKFEVGRNTSYLPATLHFSSVVGFGRVGCEVFEAAAYPPAIGLPVGVTLLPSYWSFKVTDSLTAVTVDTMVLAYSQAEVQSAGVKKDSLIVIESVGGTWVKVPIVRSDTLAGTVTVAGLSTLSDFMIGSVGAFSGKQIGFGTLLALASKTDSSVFIVNGGASARQITGVTVPDSTVFSAVPSALVIPANDSVKLAVTFRPLATRAYGGMIFVQSAGRIDTVVVSGSGRLMSLTDVRSAAVGSVVSFVGTVTRAKGSYTYMQDTSAGIVLYQGSGAVKDSVRNGAITQGDKLIIYGKTSSYNHLLEVGASDLYAYLRVARGDTSIRPVRLTLGKIRTDGWKYEAMLIRVCELQLGASTDSIFRPAKTYDVKDADTSKAVALRIPNATDGDVDSSLIRKGWFFTFTGPLGHYTSSDSTKGFQLMAVAASDIHFDSLAVINGLEGELAGGGIPKEFRLEQNYPNPFNPSTTIAFDLPRQAVVELKIYTMLGQEVAALVQGVLPAGTHQVQFQAGNLASGLYFYRIQAGPFTSVKKMMLVK